MATPVFIVLLEDGQTVRIPLPPEERGWHWFPYIPSGPETLAVVCQKKNAEKRRAGMPPLTPRYLWLHVTNWIFREERLRRDRLHTEDLDKDPSKVTASDKTTFLWIPYPDTVQVGDVAVGTTAAEKALDAPVKVTPVQVHHDWLYQLDQKLDDLALYAREIAKGNDFAAKVRQPYATEAAKLAPLHFLLGLMKRYQRGQVDDLESKLGELQEKANLYMAVNPAKFLKMPEEDLRLSLTESLRKSLHAPELKKLVDRYLQEELEPDLNTGGKVLTKLCNTLENAYEAWADSYYAAEQQEDLDNAVDVIGKTVNGAPPPEAKTALASVMSLVGTPHQYPAHMRTKWLAQQASPLEERPRTEEYSRIAGLVPTVALPAMGNLPGPSTLSVAMIKLHVARYVARKAANPTFEGNKLTRPLFLNLYQKIYQFTADERAMIDTLLKHIDSSIFGPQLKDLQGSSLGDILRNQALASKDLENKLLRDKIYDESKRLAEKVGGRIQTSKGFSWVLSGLNIFLLGAAWAQYKTGDDMFQSLSGFANIVNLGGATLTSALALSKLSEAYQVLRFLGTPGNAAQDFVGKMLASSGAAAGFGIASGVFCMISGGLTMWQERHDPLGVVFVSGAFQALGGIGLAGTAIAVVLGVASGGSIGIVLFEIGSGLCLVVGGGLADWDSWKQLNRPGTQKIFEYHLDRFEKSTAYQKMIANGATELKNALDAVKSAKGNTTFADFLDSHDHLIRMHLNGKFADADITHMMIPTPSHGPQRE
jgi:hypothetical protein